MAVKRNERAKNSAFISGLFVVVLGAALAFGAYRFLKTKSTEIYVFENNYPAGTVVSAQMFTTSQVDVRVFRAVNEGGSAGRYASMQELNDAIRNGDRLRVDVITGLPATTNLFSGSFGGTVESHLSDNLVSVELPVSLVGGMSGREVFPGTKINIIASYEENGKYVTEALFENLNVVGVAEDENGNTESVYVELQPDESLKLINAMHTRALAASIIKDGSYLNLSEVEKRFSTDIETAGGDAVIEAAVPETETEAVDEVSE